MAEVITILGVVASVVQLTDAVVKLRTVCGTFKDASTDLGDLMVEISISVKQLNRSKEYFEKVSLLDLDLVSECLEYLEQALLAVNTVTDEMQKALNRHKTVGSMKFVWKAEKLMERVERDSIATKQSRHEQTIQFKIEQILQMRMLEHASHAAYQGPTQRQVTLPSLPAITPDLALESLKKTPLSGLRRASKGRTYRAALPWWLCSKSFEIMFVQQQSSIHFSLHCYNVVSYDSEVFRAVQQGDLQSVKLLFSTGQASPADIEADGESLLERAIIRCDSNMCRFLTNQGADISYDSHNGHSALWYLTCTVLLGQRDLDYPTFRRNISELIDLLSEITPHDAQDVRDLRKQLWFNPIISPFIQIIVRGRISQARLLPPADRAQMIVQCRSTDFIEDLLGPDLSLRQVFEYVRTDGNDYSGVLYRALEASGDERLRWSDICRELIAFDQSCVPDHLHPNTGLISATVFHVFWKDCLGHVKNSLASNVPVRLNNLLNELLAYIQNLGADLGFYGQLERGPHRSDPIFCAGTAWRVVGLDTGPQPHDWKFWIAPHGCEYEWAGAFWHGVENPELYNVPGGFLQDEWEEH